MTRGFVVLMKNGKILKIVESYSDSYLSGLGLEVLNIFEENRFEEAFKDILPVDLEDGYNDDSDISPISVVLADYSAQSKTGRFLFNKTSIRGRQVGLLLSSCLHTLYIFLLNVCSS